MDPALRSKRAMVTLSTFRSLEDSPFLFDFDTPINQDNFVINQTSLIYHPHQAQPYQKQTEVVTQTLAMNGNMPDFGSKLIFSLSIRHHQNGITYCLDEPQNIIDTHTLSTRLLDRLPYMCLNNHGRRNQVKSAKIKEGDIIRLGKTYLRIIQTHQSKRFYSSFPETLNPLTVDNPTSEDISSGVKTCRICLMDDAEGLISPCRCKGSCQYVHLDCLRTWLQNKVTRHQNRLVSSYILSRFECELCKQQLPNKIIIQGKSLQFVEFHKPDQPYIILQRLQQDTRDKIIYMVTPKDQGVRLGRGNQSDIRFNDLTMSRTHSVIQFKNGHFYLTDSGSKFGSLLLLQQPQEFDRVMCLQLENKVFKMEVMDCRPLRVYSYL